MGLPDRASMLFSTGSVPAGRGNPQRSATVLDVVVPVPADAVNLTRSVQRLHGHLTSHFPYPFRITIVDNVSVDGATGTAERVAALLRNVTVLPGSEPGRGSAVRAAWSTSDAAVLAYVDIERSTDLAALLPLVAPLLSGHSELAIGTRFSHNSRVLRPAGREFVSWSYNVLLHLTLGTRFSDAGCGFMAIRTDVARTLLPRVHDPGRFFDTELLVLAERCELRIHEVPVDWVESASRVDVVGTAKEKAQGIARLGRSLATGRLPLRELREQLRRSAPAGDRIEMPGGRPRRLLRPAVVALLSTVAYLLLYAVLRTQVEAIVGNVLAVAVAAVGTGLLTRSTTFGSHDFESASRHRLHGLPAFGIAVGLTTAALAVAMPEASAGQELLALGVAHAAAGLLREILPVVRGQLRLPEGRDPEPSAGLNGPDHREHCSTAHLDVSADAAGDVQQMHSEPSRPGHSGRQS
jgi:hypothetical protein